MPDTHRSSLPLHAPETPAEQKHADAETEPILPRADFPETGTPDAVIHTDNTAVEIDPSEQVTLAEQMVPEAWQETEAPDDWMDTPIVR